jgi:hypothetical protein
MTNRRAHASTRRHPLLGLAAALVVIALVAAPAAIAASPTADQYGSKVQQIAATGSGGSSGGGGSATASTPSSGGSNSVGSLPFTGLDLGLMALVAAALVGGGFALRRASNPAKRSS